jgi:hypothetical protein
MKTKRMPVIYIAGPYSASTKEQKEKNIAVARDAAIRLWSNGFAAICPHLNTSHFEDHCIDEEVFLEGDKRILARCDGVFLLPGWEGSAGATSEKRFAKHLGIPVFDNNDVQSMRNHFNVSGDDTIPQSQSPCTIARKIVFGERAASYGHPRENLALEAELFTAYLRKCGVLADGGSLSVRNVGMLNVLQKVARDAHRPKPDNLVDIAGWVEAIYRAENEDETGGESVLMEAKQ